MRIIFMGTPGFAVPSLKTLIDNKYNVVSVVTVPDKKKGRGQVISESAVKLLALENRIDILQPINLKDIEFTEKIRSLHPDLIIVVAFRILPKEIFTIPASGSFNLHASLLPKYRGAAPINWAIINGETETGVTSFFLKEKVDTGNVIIQKKISIDPDDNAGKLHDKLAELGAEAVLETVRLIEKGNFSVSEQDNSLASPAPKIFREDCQINWEQRALNIHNFVRGLSPYPGAYSCLENKNVKIHKTNITEIRSLDNPGKIIFENKKLYVSAEDNLIEIMELQPEGKKRISALDFINGADKTKELIFNRK